MRIKEQETPLNLHEYDDDDDDDDDDINLLTNFVKLRPQNRAGSVQ